MFCFEENVVALFVSSFSGSPWLGTGPLAPDKHGKEISFLDSYARERWECVLHFMVGSKEATDGVSRDVVEILLHAGLMKGYVVFDLFIRAI